MGIRIASGHRAPWLMAACLLSAAVCGGLPVQAGPTLETTKNMAIGAQATFSNDWGQTFEVNGDLVPVFLEPFSQTTSPVLVLPTSGLASLTATVTNLTTEGGDLDASASISIDPVLGAGANGIVLNPDPSVGLPSLQIKTGDGSVIGASIIGANIGTDSLQVTGALGTTVINTLGLSAF
jgi:hypothetical protein